MQKKNGNQLQNITAADVEIYKQKLAATAQKADELGNQEAGNNDFSQISAIYSTGGPLGRAIYKSFSDQELLEAVKLRTRQLGHVPAQKEMFWVYRSYLRIRFDKWPYVLRKAGLSTQAGRGGLTLSEMGERKRRYGQLLDMVREKARELGRPPHMFEMEDIRRELKSWFTTWAEVLDAAGVDRSWQKQEILYKVQSFTQEERAEFGELIKLVRKLGRAPLRSEVPEQTRQWLIRRCKTWRNTLYQIGLEPVVKLSPFGNTYLERGMEPRRKHRDMLENSLYKLVEPDDETRQMFAEVRRIAKELKRAPLKGEIPSPIYSCLIKKCTTYRNLLYQLDLEPLDKQEAAAVKTRKKNRKSR